MSHFNKFRRLEAVGRGRTGVTGGGKGLTVGGERTMQCAGEHL